jgi:glutamate/tyrosine decarboxylase-like PLP-dependent enzyme
MSGREGETGGQLAPLAIEPSTFRTLGHGLVDSIADFLESLPKLPVAREEAPEQLRALLDRGPVPQEGIAPEEALLRATKLLLDHSVFNSHPRFWGYITGSPAPIGMLADLLSSAMNQNGSSWHVSPMATEIERQVIRWTADLIGYPADTGGLLVSGGNMGNFIGFLAARAAVPGFDLRRKGVSGSQGRLRAYASEETHTWLQKAADMFGLGTNAVRWIPVDREQRIVTFELRKAIESDLRSGLVPFLVVGNAGTVSTGAIDPLIELAALCRDKRIWFHVDGSYGGYVAMLPNAPPDLAGIAESDSVALDPHKWLYVSIEAGCALVKDRAKLRETFHYQPLYYHSFVEPPKDTRINYNEYGPENSRGFRALKVWLALQTAGRSGYERMIGENIRLAQELDHLVRETEELQPGTQNLSITTFRYVPRDLSEGTVNQEVYLNRLNAKLLARLKRSGEAYISHAIVGGTLLLRACIVNFRTTSKDIAALPELVKRIGKELDVEMRPTDLTVDVVADSPGGTSP